MYQAEIAALAAALCWTFTGAIALAATRALGAVVFNRIRMVLVFFMLVAIVTISGEWRSLTTEYLSALVISGLVGIWIGDTALFSSLRRLGPRRMSVIFASTAPMSALLAWVFLEETISLTDLSGCVAVIAGIVMAVVFSRPAGNAHHWEKVVGPLWMGIGAGLLASFCQAAGAIIAKPALESGVDPFAASAVRIGAAALLLVASIPFSRRTTPTVPLNADLLMRITVTGLLGITIGMSLVLYALGHGEAGVVMTLSSVTPVLMLPFIWIRTGRPPTLPASAGAILVVLGTALILLV